MKESGNKIITGVLYLLLAFLVVQAGVAGYKYYTGPTWVVEAYTDALKEGEYIKAYNLLNKQSLDNAVSEKQIIEYYEQLYNKQLVQVQRIGEVQLQSQEKATCKVMYTFQSKSEEAQLEMVKTKNHWEIVSPFKTSSVTIYAPVLSKVYLNGKRVTNRAEGRFTQGGLLPGNYMLEVVFPETNYKDYHQVIKVPQQTEVVLPYDMVNVNVCTVKGMEVSLGEIHKVANKEKIGFSDLLPGEYTLAIKSPYDTIEPIQGQVKIGNTNCSLKYQNMTLSEKGKKTWKTFINSFYKNYLAAIEKKDVSYISEFFEMDNKEIQSQIFNDWFIKNKDIQNAKLKIEMQLGDITAEGYLQGEITEVVELTNLEEVEGGDENRIYRLILTWDTQINIMKEEWQIANRTLKESVIAYQSEDGRWLQY